MASAAAAVRVPARPLGIHVDQAHLGGAERRLQIPVAVAAVRAEPLALRTPVHLEGRPVVLAAPGETERLEAHGFHGDGAGEDDQVRPRDRPAVLRLDRPEQPVRLVEVGVVGPTVQGREPLLAAVGAAPAVHLPVRSGAVPGHPDEEGSVVAEVGGPPALGSGHQRGQLGLEGGEVEAVERLAVVEVVAQRTGTRRVEPQRIEVQPIGPPVLVGRRALLGKGGVVRRDWADSNGQQHGYG